ncbi:hypothetical protein [uncultured Aquimonas sp.]|uniref:hypothetical protein n=1 Tax=uncultured Aquimonas sp. TaxID=385483 RepID=UPI0026055967|nr:hypothetical protein [uncultured Aquimonas sp.]
MHPLSDMNFTPRKRALILLLAVCAGPAMAAAPNPDAAQLQAAIDAFWQARAAAEGTEAASPAWKITEALGCMPAFDSDRGGVWRDHWICLGATTNVDFHADALVQVDGSDWKVVDLGGAAPACAPIKEAESALRAITGIDQLDITGEIDDGEGMLTDQRNGDPTVRHPYRVMCRYESNLASYHVFLTYADGRYVFDPGDMSGTGVPTPWHIHGKPVTSAE